MAGCYGMTACGMGEPKIYGGYGSGANAEQREAPAKLVGGRYRCVETGRRFDKLTEAAAYVGVTPSALGKAVHEARSCNGLLIVPA